MESALSTVRAGEPAYQRLFEEGALYRRPTRVPPEAAFVHSILAPIAVELNGRGHDDDGRLIIEWLEHFWPHDIAGHGRSDGVRWSMIVSTKDRACSWVLLPWLGSASISSERSHDTCSADEDSYDHSHEEGIGGRGEESPAGSVA